ncbi:porin family protein [Thermodesulfobacteriota bacterium]
MKKALMVMLLVVTMPVAVYADGGFVGIGATYGIEQFDIEDAAIAPFSVDFDDTFGVNGKVGYRWNQLAVGLEAEFLPGSEYVETQMVSGVPVTLEAEADIWAIMPFVQFFFPMIGNCEPYLKAGFGWMNLDVDMSASVPGLVAVSSEDDTDACIGAGAGIDFYVTDAVALGLSGNHVWGMNNLDEVRYWSIRAGAMFYFQ